MLHEILRGLVKHRPTREIGASARADEPALEQLLHCAIDRDAAHRFDIGLRDGLAVGDQGERLQSRGTEFFRPHLGKKGADPFCEIGPRHEAPAGRAFLQLDRPVRGRERLAQFGNGRLDLARADRVPRPRLRREMIIGRAADRLGDLCRRHRLRRRINEGLDDLDQLHGWF